MTQELCWKGGSFLQQLINFNEDLQQRIFTHTQLTALLKWGELFYFLNHKWSLHSDAPVSELSLELLLLQVVLPALLEQGHTRQWLKNLIKYWALFASWLL